MAIVNRSIASATNIGPSGFDVRAHVRERNMKAGLIPYRASAALERFIMARAPYHVATPDAPSTFRSLRKAWAAYERYGYALPVFDGGCDRTIYSTPAVNHAFRAWHDALHVTLDAGFNERGERAVCNAQCAAIRAAGLSDADVDAMRFDVWGQFVYAKRHAGAFPQDQALFVAACFAYGVDVAASMTF